LKRQKYEVKLTPDERQELERIKRSKMAKDLTKKRAKALLLLDENSEAHLTPEQTAVKVKLHRENIYALRRLFILEGMERAIYRKKRETPPVPAKVTGDVEAHIIAAACSEVPEGSQHWTLKMIADKIVLDGIVESISDETVRRTLKKRNISLT